jgi:hypothetical protein
VVSIQDPVFGIQSSTPASSATSIHGHYSSICCWAALAMAVRTAWLITAHSSSPTRHHHWSPLYRALPSLPPCNDIAQLQPDWLPSLAIIALSSPHSVPLELKSTRLLADLICGTSPLHSIKGENLYICPARTKLVRSNHLHIGQATCTYCPRIKTDF